MTKSVGGAIVLCGPSLLACLLTAVPAHAQTAIEHVIHSFGNFSNGANPYGTPTVDSSGNLDGTLPRRRGKPGVVFKCGSAGYQVLHSFKGGTDGANPYAGVTLDPAGNLYVSTYQGGTANAGVVYKIDPSGQETVLYAFTGGDDGSQPLRRRDPDSAGNLANGTPP